jgi:large subunit ribosomal protein L9
MAGVDVILLSDVEKVGLRGDVVSVARGYARNYLLPRRLAEEATPAKVAELRKREEQRARHEARSFEEGQRIAEQLGQTVLRFEVKAGPTGALFGSVTPTDVADEIWRTRKIRVDRRKIDLDTIKRIGRYDVPIEVFQDVKVEVKTLVAPEGGELPPEEELEAMAAAEEAEAAAAVEPEPAPAVDEVGVAEPETTATEAGATEGEVVPEAAEAEVPEDAFDRAVDTAIEREGEQL